MPWRDLQSSLLSLVQQQQRGEEGRTSVSQPAEMSESGSQEPSGAPNGSDNPSKRPPVGNKVTVVLGAQWGDEGKGKVVDLLAQDADMVCRCQVGYPLHAAFTCYPSASRFKLTGNLSGNSYQLAALELKQVRR